MSKSSVYITNVLFKSDKFHKLVPEARIEIITLLRYFESTLETTTKYKDDFYVHEKYVQSIVYMMPEIQAFVDSLLPGVMITSLKEFDATDSYMHYNWVLSWSTYSIAALAEEPKYRGWE